MATSADGWERSTSLKDLSPEAGPTKEPVMQPHSIVSREEWIAARKAHLAHEKEYTRARDRLSEERRALPWVKVDKSYVFDGPNGKQTLGDLFGGRLRAHDSASGGARHHAGRDIARAAGKT